MGCSDNTRRHAEFKLVKSVEGPTHFVVVCSKRFSMYKSWKFINLQLMKQMSSTDTPLGTLNMLQEKQKSEKSAYIVLSGNKGLTGYVYIILIYVLYLIHRKESSSLRLVKLVEDNHHYRQRTSSQNFKG